MGLESLYKFIVSGSEVNDAKPPAILRFSLASDFL